MIRLAFTSVPAIHFDSGNSFEIYATDTVVVETLTALPVDQLDDLLRSILTDKSVEWMLSEAVRRVTLDKVTTEAATLRALVQCVQAVADIPEDEECAEAIAEIRRVVGGAG